MKTLRFGLIGCGLMGREFASAAARWCHLVDVDVRPELVAVCNRSPGPFDWFRQHFPQIQLYTADYDEVLARPDVEAVYVAVPHHLHEAVYGAAIRAGKHLLGEKPFGIDLAANQAIRSCLAEHPAVFSRCASQWGFFPAAQRIGALLERRAFGRIIEVATGFLHSSDLDPNRPMSWKRQVEFNGVYGVLGDLGMHVCTLPFRAGWQPRNVRAILSDIVQERPDGSGGRAPCRTWDNATLLIETVDPSDGMVFPWTLKTQRIAPGQRNTWYVEILGTKASARFSTAHPKRIEFLNYTGGEQVWGVIETGFDTAYKTITGPNFEFGAPDAFQQLMAAFLEEHDRGKPRHPFAGCATPAETGLSHRLFTAALRSQADGAVMAV